MKHWLRLGLAVVLVLWLLDRLLPPDLTRYQDCSRLVVDRQGFLLRPFLSADQTWRLPASPDRVDGGYVTMLKAYEDGRFDHHPGVDPLALARAAWQWLQQGQPVSGGSTLTMQTARLLSPRPRTLAGKAVEMLRALQLEWRYTKDEILAMYLTLAPMGGNLAGVRAAAWAYWGREPDQLTPAQAALLIAIPQAPTARRPDRHPDQARRGVAQVLARLVAKGVISPATASEALAEPLPTRRRPLPWIAPHLAWRLSRQAPPGAVIRATVDGSLQRHLERLVRQTAKNFEDQATVALLVVEHASRAVRAYVSGHDFHGEAGQVDLVRAIRSPGSSLKPFLYGLAMDDLILHPETLMEDRPLRYGAWAPRNFDTGFHGRVTARQALRDSLNLPAVALADRVGPTRLAALLNRAGAELVFPRQEVAPGLALALGGVGISLEHLTGLYVALARGGEAGWLRLRETDGVTANMERLASRATAWHLTRILAGSPRPDSFSQQSGNGGRGAVAYKTGTSYGFRDAWALGYDSTHTVGIWVGRPDGSARPGSFGRNTAAPLLFQVFDLLPDGGDPRLQPAPPETLLAHTHQSLPEGLRHFRPAEATLAALTPLAGEPPRILFPPDGAELPLEDGDLALVAEGGVLPLQWLVNGVAVQQSRWKPDGLGFAKVVVVDARGRRDVAHVRFR